MPERLRLQGRRQVQQQHRQQGQEAIGAEGPGEGQQPERIGELGRNQRQRHRQHEQHQQPIGRGGGERRQPLALALRQGTFHQPASGLGQAGAQGTRHKLDPLPELAAEAEDGSGTEQRQGAGGRSGWGGGGGDTSVALAQTAFAQTPLQ